ncbi:endoplasmic reticulum aminopeptidase 2 [Sinocyclocheilus grahami]|uniref:endoplasmic reticulum aminopeptidase 2 n=1 Tax=Sinocyclocheilus grahami TaxID=75366 RepID=UPI0007AC9933|nr:PREDICTED: endoplasmic reticulum aminopeptidase 2-like [Sinocyclocheilus grahami]
MHLLLVILFFLEAQFCVQTSDSNSPAGDNLATNGLPFPWSKVRLPNYIVPVHYHLLIHPNLTTLRFNGSVKIEIDVKNNTNWLVLHSKNLKIFTATVLDEHEAHLSDKVLSVLEYPSHEQIAIFSPKILTSGEKYFLYLEFGAPLSDGFYGFYKSTYKTKAGETRVLASTHFEPTSARMALPCFDEPIFKANYTVRIRRGLSHIALSNMPLEQTVEIGNGLFEDQFEVSVKMSSYLLAFIVCDFRSVSGMTATGINISIYAVPEKWHQTHYALEAALRLMEFYEQYFNILYPLPKLDLIAIPDFQSGAMENWGLTTYMETSLLYDPDISSASDKLWVTMVIGHELAHQVLYIKHILSLILTKTLPTQYSIKISFFLGILTGTRRLTTSPSLPNTCTVHTFYCTYTNLSNPDVLTLDEEVDWVKLNSDMNGYYIVHYDEEGWNALTELLSANHTALSFKDRASLIHNAFQLVTAGRLSLNRALDLIGYLNSETHNVPLLQGLGYLQSFYKLIDKRNITDVTHNLKTYILQYFRDVIDKQSWSDDGMVSDRRLREEVLSLACDFDYPPCLEKAKQLYNSWVESSGTISLPTDVSETVYMVGAQDDSGWAYLLEKYGVSMCETEKSKFLSALASSKDSEKLSRLLQLGMDGTLIKPQNLPSLIYMVARNPVGHFLAWDFVKKHWNELVEKFPLGSFGIRNIIVGTVTQFSSTEELREVEDFFKSITEQVSQLRVIQVATENVEKNIMWLSRNLETMRTWLQQRLN